MRTTQTKTLTEPVVQADELLKVTALQYLADALTREQFEDCAQLIGTAKQYGASENDVKEILTAYIRNKARKPAEAYLINKYRQRF